MIRYATWSAPVALLWLLIAPANSQPAAVSGPALGFIYSRPSKLVQPLLGVPGSSHIGASVIQEVEFASVAPDGNWAFIKKSGEGYFVSGLPSRAPAPVSIAGLLETVDTVTWNRDGSYALLYSSAAGALQRVQLSGAPSADAPVEVSALGQPATFAIAPSGQQIAFGVPGAGLYTLTPGETPALASAMSQPAALAFDAAGESLYAADAAGQQILQFTSGSGPQVFASLSQPDGAPLNPVGMAVSGDGKYLMLADGSTQSVLVYDATSRNLVNTIALQFAPTRFETLSSAPYFLLNGDRSSEWLLVLDGRAAPNVFFVPSGEERGR